MQEYVKVFLSTFGKLCFSPAALNNQ